MIALTSPFGSKAFWYLSRGTGAVSLVLLTTVVVLGIANVVRWSPPRTPRFVLQHVHRNISLLALVFIALHVASAVFDSFAPIRWLDAVVPFRSAYRAIWLGFGAVALDLLLAIAITSLVRARLGYRTWRAVHWATYACWGLAVVHGAGTGSDTRERWMLALTLASCLAVLIAVIWRASVGWTRWEPARTFLVAGAVVLPVALGVWMVRGPLGDGWAARAGTPAKLLVAAGRPERSVRAETLVLPARATFAGAVHVRHFDEQVTFSARARTSGAVPLSLNIELDGQDEGGGLSVRSGSVVLTPPRGAAVYRGAVTGITENTLTARLADGHGDVIDVRVALVVSGNDVSGQLAIGGVSTGPLT